MKEEQLYFYLNQLTFLNISHPVNMTPSLKLISDISIYGEDTHIVTFRNESRKTNTNQKPNQNQKPKSKTTQIHNLITL